jgi:hypothetical protein
MISSDAGGTNRPPTFRRERIIDRCESNRTAGRTRSLIAALVLPALLSCKTPFSTREPEPPVTGQSSWIQPTSPSYVMVNLRKAVAEKNINNYLRCLADTGLVRRTFRFVAEPSVSAANPGLFNAWGKENEQNYLNQLMVFLPKDSLSSIQFNLRSENTFQDSVILVQDYVLTLAHKQQAACPKILAGQAEFRLARSMDDLWYIYRWTDYSTGGQPTHSVLRVFYGK